jgi:tRNA dimethylallyltransferase
VGTDGNPRRRAREEELRICGFEPGGSIWGGRPVFETGIVYLRPPRGVLDEAIAKRSRKIVEEGVEEVRSLMWLPEVNDSVRQSIGVRELSSYIRGEIPLDEAEIRISARTRRLARRQIRWFDKLARTLTPDIPLAVIEESSGSEQYSRARVEADDIIRTW